MKIHDGPVSTVEAPFAFTKDIAPFAEERDSNVFCFRPAKRVGNGAGDQRCPW